MNKGEETIVGSTSTSQTSNSQTSTSQTSVEKLFAQSQKNFKNENEYYKKTL